MQRFYILCAVDMRVRVIDTAPKCIGAFWDYAQYRTRTSQKTPPTSCGEQARKWQLARRRMVLADHKGYPLNHIDPVAADIPDVSAIDGLSITDLVGGAHAQLVLARLLRIQLVRPRSPSVAADRITEFSFVPRAPAVGGELHSLDYSESGPCAALHNDP